MGPAAIEIDKSALVVRDHSALAVCGPNPGSDLHSICKERSRCTHRKQPCHLIEKYKVIHGQPECPK